MNTLVSVATVAALGASAALAACSQQSQGRSVATPSSPEAAEQAQGCPMQGHDSIQAIVSDTPDGAAVTFIASQQAVLALRANLQAMDQANSSRGDPFAACPCIMQSGLQGGSSPPLAPQSNMSPAPANRDAWLYEANPQPGFQSTPSRGRTMMQPMATVPADTSVDETSTGGVLRLRAKEPAQAQALRDEVRLNVEAMKRGCGGAS
jgi:hypothetical protein